MKKPLITVAAQWDEDAQVWVATSNDVPGLVTEAATIEELRAKLQVMIPDLLACDEELRDSFPAEVALHVTAESRLQVHV